MLNKTSLFLAPKIDQAPGAALMIAPPNGAPVTLYPSKPGHMTISETMGPSYLGADVYVLLHPLHAVTTLDGHFRIDGVPVGKLKVFTRLVSIHQEDAKSVEITAGTVTNVNFSLRYSAAEAGAMPSAPQGATLK